MTPTNLSGTSIPPLVLSCCSKRLPAHYVQLGCLHTRNPLTLPFSCYMLGLYWECLAQRWWCHTELLRLFSRIPLLVDPSECLRCTFPDPKYNTVTPLKFLMHLAIFCCSSAVPTSDIIDSEINECQCHSVSFRVSYFHSSRPCGTQELLRAIDNPVSSLPILHRPILGTWRNGWYTNA